MINWQILWLISLFLLPFLLPVVIQAVEEKDIREKLHTVFGLYLTPYEAYNMKQQDPENVLLVDVWARPELKYVESMYFNFDSTRSSNSD